MLQLSATAKARGLLDRIATATRADRAANVAGLVSRWIGAALSSFKAPEGTAAFSLSEGGEPVASIILGHQKAFAARVPPVTNSVQN